HAGPITVSPGSADTAPPSAQDFAGINAPTSQTPPFQKTVAFLDFTDWETSKAGQASISLDAPIRRLYQRIVAVQSTPKAQQVNGGLILTLVVLGVLFAIIEGSALVMGGAL